MQGWKSLRVSATPLRTGIALGIGCVFLTALTGKAGEADATLTKLDATNQFKFVAPYASLQEFHRRLGFVGALSNSDLTKEIFRVVVPEDYSTNSTWGLLVWISPSNGLQLPKSWFPELAKKHMLLVTAVNSGNDRPAIDRCWLALNAACNMSRNYRIDPKRIVVGGFSGGGRIASILGVCYADLFAGGLCVCGVDFYDNVKAESTGFYAGTYKPDPIVLLRAKRLGRFVLLTGEHDLNRENTRSTAENGFKSHGFSHVLYLEIPGMKHAIPDAPVLSRALDFLLPGTGAS